jgi:CHRD domain
MRKPLVIVGVLVAMLAVAGVAGADGLKFGAELNPGEEVPAPVEVTGEEEGEVKFESDGTSVDFELKWNDLTSTAVAAHIHCEVVGVPGPIGVTLFQGAMGTEGEVQDTFTAPDPNNTCGWDDLADVLGAMATGGAYVNVHTLINQPGEIRGQIAVDD